MANATPTTVLKTCFRTFGRSAGKGSTAGQTITGCNGKGLLNDADRKRLFGVPDDDGSLIRLYSLGETDRDFILSKRGARDQLGMAVQISLLGYPDIGLRLEDETPVVLVQFLAQQIGAPWPVFLDYARRDTTRREHFGKAAERLGFRVCTSADRRDLLVCATNEAMTTDKGSTIVSALLQRLRDHRIVLPAPASIERIGLAGHARARRLASEAMIVRPGAAQAARLDELLVNDPALKRTRIARHQLLCFLSPATQVSLILMAPSFAGSVL
ncbi:MAG TPA: DUF4158 domain-containing protein [Methylocystis sp.]